MKSLIFKFKTLSTGFLFFVLSYFALELLLMIPAINGLYGYLEKFIYYQIFIPTAHPSEHLTIIDEEDNIYDRKTYALLISGLNRLGAKVIALDVLFDEKRDSNKDAALVDATKAASDKIIHAIEFFTPAKHTVIPPRFKLNISFKPSTDSFVQNICGAALPFEDLLQVTSHLGFVVGSTDFASRDDQYFPMIINYNDKLYPSLPLLAVMKFLGCSTDSLSLIISEEIRLCANSKIYQIPLDTRSQTLINFISPQKFFAGKHITIAKALDYIDKDIDQDIKDKIILIGNSFDSKEQTWAPHFQSYPNLFIYASLISQILNGEVLKEGILESLFISLFFVITGIILLLFFPQKFDRFNSLYIYIPAFLLMLLFEGILLNFRIKTYVLLPYFIFCITYASIRKCLGPKKKVFISYNHRDIAFARKLKTAIETSGILTIIDIETMKFGDEIQDFINQSVRDTDFTISIISKNSLKSVWIIAESLETLIYEKVERKKKFVPVFIDKYFLEDAFQSEIIEEIVNKIEKIEQEIIKISEKHSSTVKLDNEKMKLFELRNNIDKILKKLNESLVADFSNDKKFKENLPKLIEIIKKTTKRN